MMMKSIIAAVAIAASQLGMASANCGWKGEACCHIQYNNPNIGDCYDRSVCWEGLCMDCGTNGKIACRSGQPCEDGFLLNADGWCYTAPNQRPPVDFGCSNGCGHGSVCFWGRCEACGNNGQPKCDEGAECGQGLIVQPDGFCATSQHCGWERETCCPHNQCYNGLMCMGGKCMRGD